MIDIKEHVFMDDTLTSAVQKSWPWPYEYADDWYDDDGDDDDYGAGSES
jgi:hypothetical protein